MDVVEPAMVLNAEQRNVNKDEAAAMPAKVSLGQRLEYRGLRLGVALAQVLPIRALTAIGAGLAWTAGPWLRQNRRALTNLAIAFPEKSEAERRRIARAMWANMGRIFAETLVLDRIITDTGRVVIEDHAHWQARMGAPGPAIACTLHLGNWELATVSLNRYGRAPAGVYKPLANPLVDRWLAGARRRHYPAGPDNARRARSSISRGRATASALFAIISTGAARRSRSWGGRPSSRRRQR